MTTTQDLLPRIEAGDTTITGQEIFEAVVRHLHAQGRQAVQQNVDFTGPSSCAYKEEGSGRKCAVGCLIPDSAYNVNLESTPIENILRKMPQNVSVVFNKHALLLRALQQFHDFFFTDGWTVTARNNIQRIAQNNALDAEFTRDLKARRGRRK